METDRWGKSKNLKSDRVFICELVYCLCEYVCMCMTQKEKVRKREIEKERETERERHLSCNSDLEGSQ